MPEVAVKNAVAVVTLVPDKECKHSIRYKAVDERPLVKNVYLNRSAFVAEPMPRQLRLTIAPAGSLPAAGQGAKRVTLAEDALKVHSVRYATEDRDAPLDNLYVSRDAWERMPRGVDVLVEAA